MTELFKYRRTPHLPFSEGRSDDDKVLSSLDHFQGKRIIVTEKMDGENSTIYRDNFHARSIDSRHHYSRDWLKSFHATVKYLIPDDWRICGENLYAQHSIIYDDLESYFYGFSVWNDKNECLNWDMSMAWFKLLGITPVNVIWTGVFDEKALIQLANNVSVSKSEGFVVRLEEGFHYDDFGLSIAKWVRKNHVDTDDHWMSKKIIPNRLKTK